MKVSEIRDLSVEELVERIRSETDQLRQLHFQHAVAELPNPMILRHKRRLVAQMKTLLEEKRAAE